MEDNKPYIVVIGSGANGHSVIAKLKAAGYSCHLQVPDDHGSIKINFPEPLINGEITPIQYQRHEKYAGLNMEFNLQIDELPSDILQAMDELRASQLVIKPADLKEIRAPIEPIIPKQKHIVNRKFHPKKTSRK